MRPRTIESDLPSCVYFKHGGYYYVKKGKWTHLGANRKDAIERAILMGAERTEKPELLARFLFNKFTMLKARPQSRTGRLKVVSVTAADLLEMARASDWRCAVTGLQMTLEVINGRRPYAPSIDRIDSALDYVPGNVRVVCVAANLAMNVWGDEVLLRMSRGIVPRRDRLLDGKALSDRPALGEPHG